MNVAIRTKLEPFGNNEPDGFVGYYVWNANDERDLLGTVTRSGARRNWTHSYGKFGEHTRRRDAIAALVRTVQTKRLKEYAAKRLREESTRTTDEWREEA